VNQIFCPDIIVVQNGFVSVTAVNKNQAKWRFPYASYYCRTADNRELPHLPGQNRLLFCGNNFRVSIFACFFIQQIGIKIGFSRLLFFRTGVMIDRKKNGGVFLTGRSKING
jgi:hypothetical protein